MYATLQADPKKIWMHKPPPGGPPPRLPMEDRPVLTQLISMKYQGIILRLLGLRSTEGNGKDFCSAWSLMGVYEKMIVISLTNMEYVS